MLPDLRFVLGAAVATAILASTALGLATSVRLAHQAKVGPLEASRSLAFAERADWDQVSDNAQRFEALLQRAGHTPGGLPAESSPIIPPSAFIWPSKEMRDQDDTTGSKPQSEPATSPVTEKPAAPDADEPQTTGTAAATSPSNEPVAESETAAGKTETPPRREPVPTDDGDRIVKSAAATPNADIVATEPASPQAVVPDAPQLQKAAPRKRVKRIRRVRTYTAEQHAFTGYPIAPAPPTRPARQQEPRTPTNDD